MKGDIFARIGIGILFVIIVLQAVKINNLQRQVQTLSSINASNFDQLLFLIPCLVSNEYSISNLLSLDPAWSASSVENSRVQGESSCLTKSPIDYTIYLNMYGATQEEPSEIHYSLPTLGN